MAYVCKAKFKRAGSSKPRHPVGEKLKNERKGKIEMAKRDIRKMAAEGRNLIRKNAGRAAAVDLSAEEMEYFLGHIEGIENAFKSFADMFYFAFAAGYRAGKRDSMADKNVHR